MRNIIIVGKMRQGKTHEAKRIAASLGFPLIVNDVNAEWGQRPLDVGEFLDTAEARHGRPTTFVWEEATGYLSNRRSPKERERVERAVVRRFHTKHVNVFLFHSLRAVPVWLMDYADRLVLFPTSDRPSLIRAKFKGWDSILEAWERVNDPRRPVIAVSEKGDRIRKPEDLAIFAA